MPPTSRGAEVTLRLPASPQDLALATSLGLRASSAQDPTGWQIVRDGGKLQLVGPGDSGPIAVELDFRNPLMRNRLRTSRRSDPLPRAVGMMRRPAPPRVVDATAGLCRDAAVLAHLGCEVTAVEQVPALAMLACVAAAEQPFEGRLRVVAADAVRWLGRLAPGEQPDVVVLDPMFTDGGKAQVKKEMQACRAVCGPSLDEAELFEAARRTARERVVVKRHSKAPPLAPGVSFEVRSERVRFDVYVRSD